MPRQSPTLESLWLRCDLAPEARKPMLRYKARELAAALKLPIPDWAASAWHEPPVSARRAPAIASAPSPLKVPTEIALWQTRHPGSSVERTSDGIVLYDGRVARVFPTEAAACASVAL